MRVALLTSLTMVAFALNSILNRAAVEGGHADAASFAMLRVASGALALCLVLGVRRGRLDLAAPRRWVGGAALAVYMIGFSLAYRSLDAGLGALILFGTVQISLFAHAAFTGTPPERHQTVGAGIAFAGLLLALWPTGGAPLGALSGAALMLAAGLGWAAYTISGRSAPDAIAASAAQFVLCLPFMALLFLSPSLSLTPTGLGLAVTSGALTSGMGYALWYHVLPMLPGARAAIVQLAVPVIAIALGALLLGEDVGWKTALAGLFVLGGIGLALRRRAVPTGRS